VVAAHLRGEFMSSQGDNGNEVELVRSRIQRGCSGFAAASLLIGAAAGNDVTGAARVHGVHIAGSATVDPGSTTSSLAGSTLSGLAVTTAGFAGNTSTSNYRCGHHFRRPHAGQ
jgi:hypothetical protein